MENTPAVSVVVPMYNAEKYIAETLGSLLMQTFTDFEIILVNDCSTDKSRAIAESYLEKFGGRMELLDNEKKFGTECFAQQRLASRGGRICFLHGRRRLAFTQQLGANVFVRQTK